ncbi:MAG TPA: efflux transporter outer membrane subunit, partial [Tepidisphaeraceae bacterium]|nr:efflux transporter outer membrane subunit [Tepidisphaeraceae bacterium]
DMREWWKAFHDSTLDSLVQRAVESNLDLQQAELRIRQARATRAIAAGGLWPNVDVSASYRRSRSTGVGSADFYQVGFDASWELDIFGRVRRGVEAADADIVFAIEDRRDVLVTLLSEVALNYMDLRGFQRQIAIAQKNLETERRSLDLTRRRAAGGFVSGLDVANAEAEVASNESRIPLLEQNVQQVIYSLSVLLGREPGALLTELIADAPIPATPPAVPVGLPSELLRRRPDIRRAEANLHAATARVGVATADLFPRFSLTGSLGTSGSQPKDLVNWDNRFWSIGPSVSWPIFDAGKIRANIGLQTAIQEQLLVGYRSTILLALQDVENALIAYAKEQQHQASLIAAVAANRRALDLATQLYTQGQTSFLDVLLAQRSLLGSEDALVQSERTMATNLIALYKALGGGWEISP